MFIKVYLHSGNLESFIKGSPVNARIQFIGQYDIEMILNVKDIHIISQTDGLVIRKKKWYEKLFNLA